MLATSCSAVVAGRSRSPAAAKQKHRQDKLLKVGESVCLAAYPLGRMAVAVAAASKRRCPQCMQAPPSPLTCIHPLLQRFCEDAGELAVGRLAGC